MNLNFLYALTAEAAPIVAKNIGIAVADGLSIGVASAFKKSVEEIKEAICIIWLKLVVHPNLHHRHTIQPRLEYKRHIPT